MPPKLHVRPGQSDSNDPHIAATELGSQMRMDDAAIAIFFCSSRYDLKQLGTELSNQFTCPVIGCTTAGEISSGNGFQKDSIVGAALASSALVAHPYLIRNVDQFGIDESLQLAQIIRNDLNVEKLSTATMFSFLLVDGLSKAEEMVAASLYSALDEIQLIGGSAGDDLEFSATHIYHDGEFLSNCAILTVFETSLPFYVFKTHHLKATDEKLVITGTIPNMRCVTELNGFPAVDEYSRVIGVSREQLTPAIFSKYPLLLKIGDEYYVRSISTANNDGSLSLFCDIDTGLVVTVARSGDLEKNVRNLFLEIKEKISQPQFILACDCVLRRLEMEDMELNPTIDKILTDCNFLGFSTYGEQFNSIHVNQTLTGIVLGE